MIKDYNMNYDWLIDRGGKSAGVFTVVKFPNSACLGSGGLNGTCFTASECTTKGEPTEFETLDSI